jgi:hypothetical protein
VVTKNVPAVADLGGWAMWRIVDSPSMAGASFFVRQEWKGRVSDPAASGALPISRLLIRGTRMSKRAVLPDPRRPNGKQFCRSGCACTPAFGREEARGARGLYGRVGDPALPGFELLWTGERLRFPTHAQRARIKEPPAVISS